MEESTENVICRVCGDALGSEAALACRSCGTPHHKDCWEFTGVCSVYGCGATRTTAFVRQGTIDLDQPIPAEEILAIDENTPVPPAYRRRDTFPSSSYFGVLAYNNSITGLKLFGMGFLLWSASFALGKIVPPFLFLSAAGCLLLLLAPIYWLAASGLGIIALATGLVDGVIEQRAIHGFLVGSFAPILVALYADLGSLFLGAASILFVASFFFQLVRSVLSEKLSR